MSYHLVIYGRPRPGERAGTTPEGRRYSQTNTVRVKRDVGAAWMFMAGRPSRRRARPIEGPASVRIIAVYARPASHFLSDGRLSAAGLRFPFPTTTKADLDNLAKPILDGLTGLAWDDDHAVCSLTVEKEWDDGRGERTEVRIASMIASSLLGESAK